MLEYKKQEKITNVFHSHLRSETFPRNAAASSSLHTEKHRFLIQRKNTVSVEINLD